MCKMSNGDFKNFFFGGGGGVKNDFKKLIWVIAELVKQILTLS